MAVVGRCKALCPAAVGLLLVLVIIDSGESANTNSTNHNISSSSKAPSSSSSSTATTTSQQAPGSTAACLKDADDLAQQKRHALCAARYVQCSRLTNNSMEAGLALFLAAQVYRHQLHNMSAALEAAQGGWRVSHGAELACALAELNSGPLGRPREAADWAHTAIAAGCVRGACRSVMRAVYPEANAAPCAWWQPFVILQRLASAADADATATRKAFIATKVAHASAWFFNHNHTAYFQLGPYPLPVMSRVERPGACGTSRLPDSVLRMAAADVTGGGGGGGWDGTVAARRPQLHIIALASNTSAPGFTNLLASAHKNGLRVTPLSPPSEMGHEVGGKFGLRLQAMASHINLLHEDDVVIAIDAYDVVFAGGERAILSGFIKAVGGGTSTGGKTGQPRDVALFAAESAIWPDTALLPGYPAPERKYRFLNAGGYMGTVRALRCVFAVALVNLTDSRYTLLDDQLALTLAYLASVNTSAPLIALDYGHRVFAALYDHTQGWDFKPKDWERRPGVGWANRLTGGVPSILHANGRQGVKWMHSQLLHDVLTGFRAGNSSAAAAAAGSGTPSNRTAQSSSSTSSRTQPTTAALSRGGTQQAGPWPRARAGSSLSPLAWARPASHWHVLLFVACAAAMALATACMAQLVLSNKQPRGAVAAVGDAGPADLEQQQQLMPSKLGGPGA